MVLKKYEIEQALREEKQDIAAGRLKEDNPLDLSDDFRVFCEACRRGDLRICQEKISEGININARDKYDYTPLILASLCGHFETVQLLLESGALCERDTFQGERCLYNALNDRIRDLLLSYDFSKSTNLLQPLTAHVTSLRTKSDWPDTSDISITTQDHVFHLHKFLLAARSPYFAERLRLAPSTSSYKIPPGVPSQSLDAVIKFIYLGEVVADRGPDEEHQAVLTGIDRLSKHLQLGPLLDDILRSADRRLARQVYDDQTARGRDQLASWFREHVLRQRMRMPRDKVDQVKWDRSNSIFADVLLRADEPNNDEENKNDAGGSEETRLSSTGIPLGTPVVPVNSKQQAHSVLYPVHRAMLLRSEFFSTMFSSGFREAQHSEHLQVVPIDCSPDVLEIVLTYLYTESTEIPLDLAIDVLFAADLLVIEKLKQRATIIISTLGNGSTSVAAAGKARDSHDVDDPIDVYEVVRAGWDTKVHRLEEFGARYIAQRLERFIDEPDFLELVKESASRIKDRQAVDTVELIDDIRYHLSERFRLRFEDSGLDAMLDESEPVDGSQKVVDEMDATDGKKGDALNTDGETTSRTTGQANPASLKPPQPSALPSKSVIHSLDGRQVDDELAQDAVNYEILLGKIDVLLEKLDLEA